METKKALLKMGVKKSSKLLLLSKKDKAKSRKNSSRKRKNSKK